jgi:Family of unknown function (DUF6152)
MNRRSVLCWAAIPVALAVPRLVLAHHGWSSFDQSRPIYLEGKAVKVAWRNPHAELTLEIAQPLALPAGLKDRKLPAQSASVDGPGLVARAALPTRKDRQWTIELAPLTRMEAWKVAPITEGQSVAMIGFTFEGEKGDAVLRVEYLFVGDAVYGLRSAPA